MLPPVENRWAPGRLSENDVLLIIGYLSNYWMSAPPDYLSLIIWTLSQHAEGLKVKDIAAAVHLNRNAVAKYLGILHQQGQVDVCNRGKAKIYTISRRVPYAVLAEISLDCLLGLDRGQRCVVANALFYSWTGLTPGDLLGKPLSSLPGPVLNDMRLEELAKAGLLSRGEPIRMQYTRRGQCGILEIQSLPVIFGNGSTGSALSIREISRHEWFPRHLINSMPNPVFCKDRNGIYTGCNRAFESFTGLSREQVIGRSVYDIAPRDLADRYACADRELFSRPGTQVYVSQVKAADGSLREVVFHKATITDLDGDVAGIVGVIFNAAHCREGHDDRQTSGMPP